MGRCHYRPRRQPRTVFQSACIPVTQTSQNPSLESPEPAGWLQWVYLVLAICGAVFPWLANLDFIREHGQSFDAGLFLQLANANDAASSMTRDLAVSATAIIIWMVAEARRLRMRNLIWPLAGCVLIAFAFGAPLFLFLRQRRLLELSSERS